MRIYLNLSIVFFCFIFNTVFPTYGQDSNSIPNKKIEKFARQTETKAKTLQKRITRRADKTISKLIRQEKKLNDKLVKVDSLGNISFTFSIDSLKSFRKLLRNKKLQLPDQSNKLAQYTPMLDSAKCLLKYFGVNNLNSEIKGAVPRGLQSSLEELTYLEKTLQCTGQLEQYIRNRKAELNSIFSKYDGLIKYNGLLKKWGKEYYYYAETLKNYKTLFNYPTRVQAEVLKLANKIPAFQDFIKEHNELSALFSQTGKQDFSGLQTRAQVNDLVNGQMTSFGSKGKELISQKIAEAQEMLSEAIGKCPAISDASAMPDFKPNNQKTKTLLQRIEFGMDFQFNRKTQALPTSASTGFSIGYKLTDKASLGAGVSTDLNIGRSWKHPEPTADHLCFRSFAEYNIAKEFYVRGGWERQFTQTISNIDYLDQKGFYRESALLGISRKLGLPGKIPFTKKSMNGRVMIMYDFLYHRHVPATPAIVFRVSFGS
jgi:hypothetical protein